MASEGEWSHVQRKGRRLRNAPMPTNVAADSLHDGLRPNPNPELSVEDLRRYHETLISKNEVISNWWVQLREALESALSKPNPPAITKAVCLGPGPFEPNDGSPSARQTAHMQTAAFRFIVDHLKSQSNQEISCLIQEPRFTEIDKEFCSTLGLKVVESPEAFAHVDENTLLFGIHMELHVYNQAMPRLPGIYIGTSLDEWEKAVRPDAVGGESLSRFSIMDATYDTYNFPELGFLFWGTIMYWRRSET
ncbi:hypothetical protein VTK26DRAFT_5252 [Humicola hyalothermophila]